MITSTASNSRDSWTHRQRHCNEYSFVTLIQLHGKIYTPLNSAFLLCTRKIDIPCPIEIRQEQSGLSPSWGVFLYYDCIFQTRILILERVLFPEGAGMASSVARCNYTSIKDARRYFFNLPQTSLRAWRCAHGFCSLVLGLQSRPQQGCDVLCDVPDLRRRRRVRTNREME